MPSSEILTPHERRAQSTRWLIHSLHFLCCATLSIGIFATGMTSKLAILTAFAANLVLIVISVLFSRRAVRQMAGQIELFEEARHTKRQIEELFAMTDMLQAADTPEDAGIVLKATSERLLPMFSGALYVFNNSRDRLDLAKSWQTDGIYDPPETLLPSACWALKRGKPHVNDPKSNTLCCAHHREQVATVEVPMLARGTVHGLLILAIDCDNGFERVMAVRRLARALADSMSLALSNIALRETLRTQSLRDPLTGLYNRRYMEDALERYLSLAERSGVATSVIMIDLDNFKRLNDEFGHAKGDAVLRDVAAQLVGALRPSDVVSRYGGEELVVILPNCGLDDAMVKAEMLRERIASLSEPHGAPVSASLGVASIPETSVSYSDIIPMADAALYAAKDAGRNCVRLAERRFDRDDGKPRLAKTG